MNINLKNEIVLHILSVIGAVALTNSVKTKLNNGTGIINKDYVLNDTIKQLDEDNKNIINHNIYGCCLNYTEKDSINIYISSINDNDSLEIYCIIQSDDIYYYLNLYYSEEYKDFSTEFKYKLNNTIVDTNVIIQGNLLCGIEKVLDLGLIPNKIEDDNISLKFNEFIK